MDNANQNLLDLEALAPKPQQLKLPDGTIVDVAPPKMQNSLRVSLLGKQLQNANTLNDLEIEELVGKIMEEIVKVIPQLSGINLSTPQILAVITLVSEMSTPSSIKIMQAQGIETNTDPKV